MNRPKHDLNLIRREIERRAWASYEARDPFGAFCKRISPDWEWDWPHLRFIRQEILKSELGSRNGQRFRLVLCVPPQHGKTELATIRYIAYRLWLNPDLRVLLLSYNQERAERELSLPIQRMVMALGLRIDPRRSGLKSWGIDGRRGGVKAAGVDTGIAGHPADLTVMDDLIGTSGDAESEAYRKNLWRWVKSDVYPRVQARGDLLAVNTRWHEGDHIGEIQASAWGKEFRFILLRAIGEGDDPPGFVRDPSGALCPGRFTITDLEDKRKVLLEEFETQYQCRPYKRGGSLFLREKAIIVDDYPRNMRVTWRAWDKGGGGKGSDYSAGVLGGIGPDELFYVIHGIRGQWDYAERDSIIKQYAQLDDLKFPGNEIFIEQEGGSGGKQSAQISKKDLRGFAVTTETSTGAKESNWKKLSSYWNAGNVRIVSGDWNEEYIAEFVAAPNGRNDDFIDATRFSFNQCNLAPRGADPDSIASGGGIGVDYLYGED